ncbi:hypothetical protein, partial [Methanospirillum sp.]|uniref:hypothetical protein n=1 Tax=Methanospirillum sp. TaxID=45200 RepID=UPI002C02EB2F
MVVQNKKINLLLIFVFISIAVSFSSADNYTDVPTPQPIETFDWDEALKEEYEDPVDWEEIDIPVSLNWEEPAPIIEPELPQIENLDYELSLANGAVYGVGLNSEGGTLEFTTISVIEPVEEDYFGSWADFDIDFEISVANGAIFGEGLTSEEGPPKIETFSTMEPAFLISKTEEETEQENFEISLANGAIFGVSLTGLADTFEGDIPTAEIGIQESEGKEKRGAQVTTPSGSQEIT